MYFFAFQLYNFGETVSIVFWTDEWRPESFYDKIASNRERGMHTLCLLGESLFCVFFFYFHISYNVGGNLDCSTLWVFHFLGLGESFFYVFYLCFHIYYDTTQTQSMWTVEFSRGNPYIWLVIIILLFGMKTFMVLATVWIINSK